jgi:hypothetical protein
MHILTPRAPSWQILAISLLLAAQGAYAEDFRLTIKIPVHVERLHPDVDKVAALCRLFNDKNQEETRVQVDSNQFVDDVNDAGRSYQGTLINTFVVDEKTALKINWEKLHYSCRLSVRNGKSNAFADIKTNSSTSWARAKSNALTEVEGKVVN